MVIQTVKSLIQVGESARKALVPFITGAYVSLGTTIFLILPKLIANRVEYFIENYLYTSLNIQTLNKFIFIMFLCNLILAAFDIMGALGYWNFGRAIVQAMH